MEEDMFQLCCIDTQKCVYDIVHNPRPLKWTQSTINEIEHFLWYVPNIDSFQSNQTEIIDEKIYDDFVFEFIMSQLGMSEDTDVLWLTKNDMIETTYVSYYQNEVCINCQKVIICAYANQTKTKNLLRTIRNAIAHGQFSFAENLFIGFNKNGVDSLGNPKYKGIVKLPLPKLLEALKKLESPKTKEALVGYAFKKVGYSVISDLDQTNGNVGFDWLVEKDGRRYYIEVKSFKNTRYIHTTTIHQVLHKMKMKADNIPVILIVDSSRITNEVKKLSIEMRNFQVIDSTEVKKLLEGQDVLKNFVLV